MGLSLNLQLPTADLMQKQANQQYLALLNKTNFANFMGSQLTGLISDGIGDAFGNSGIGRQVGNVFGNGLGSVGGTMLSNYLKGNTLMQGVSKNLGASLQGAASGLAADFAGKGVNALMGDSKLGNFAGGATSSALGLILGGGIGNPLTFGANVLGSGLSSMLGPSKEYGGKYGNITLTMDSIYGGIQGVAGLFGPVGAGVSAAMALNKGLSNLFGSTDGMTKQDAILGSAFMPAPVKWLNAGLGKKTGSFDNQSWQNQEKANSFMLNGFGDLGERFDLARYEANKKYGLFSQHARRKAQRNIDFANVAWDLVLAMADLNELQNIRSLYMSSINNLRYAQMLGGGLKPLLIGKRGMKILNNQTNHNMGLRLLSAAALIDNKAMILSALGGTKMPEGKYAITGLLYEDWKKLHEAEMVILLWLSNQPQLKKDTRTTSEIQRSHQQAEKDREVYRKELLKLKAEEGFDNFMRATSPSTYVGQVIGYKLEGLPALATDALAFGAAGALKRGFRWAFNKARLLVRVPKTTLEVELFPRGLTNNEPLKAAGTNEINISPEDLYKYFLKLDGYYFLGHGTGRTNVDPKIIFKNGLRIKNGEISNTTSPISESNLTTWPHANSEEIIILPARTERTMYDAVHGHIPSDWYDANTFHWTDNPKIIGRGPFAVREPNASFTELTIGGISGVYTKPEAILGSYNTRTHTLRLNSNSQYKFPEFEEFPRGLTKLLASLESDYKGKPIILSVPKTMRKADSDVAKMNEYHAANVQEYNQSTGNNVTSVPFRTDYNGRLIKVLPNEEFNTVVRNKNTNAPSGSELNVGGVYSKNDDTVYLRNTGNPSNNYHEFLHSSHYGETNPEVTLWRILQLIDEDKVSKLTPRKKAYYISETETPVHLRLLGERMNIKVGDPYPGDEAFDKMLNEYGIAGATYYMKRDTSKAKQLLWKGLNGTLFGGLTAVTLYNKSK